MNWHQCESQSNINVVYVSEKAFEKSEWKQIIINLLTYVWSIVLHLKRQMTSDAIADVNMWQTNVDIFIDNKSCH